jgi:hypothetical protein
MNTNKGLHAFLLNFELNLRYLEICLAAILVLKRGDLVQFAASSRTSLTTATKTPLADDGYQKPRPGCCF